MTDYTKPIDRETNFRSTKMNCRVCLTDAQQLLTHKGFQCEFCKGIWRYSDGPEALINIRAAIAGVHHLTVRKMLNKSANQVEAFAKKLIVDVQAKCAKVEK